MKAPRKKSAKKSATISEVKLNDAVSVLRHQLAKTLGYSHDGKRDLYSVLGYNRVVSVGELHEIYQRNDVANRVIRAFPQATWREKPNFLDESTTEKDERGENIKSKFTQSVEDFFDDRNLYRAIERADRLASIGRFGLLFLGFQDGQLPHQPLQPGNQKLLFVQPYSEIGISISKWDENMQSPRYGLPVVYNISGAQGVDISSQGMTSAKPMRSFAVHHSRVIHISEFIDQDDVFGIPRLLPVYNRFKDLEKVVGGSAETFWLAADRGLAIWADKEAEYSEEDVEDMQQQAEEFQHKLRRILVGRGMTAQELGGAQPDPEMISTVLLDLIAGATGIPKRILLGTERGELASGQDENNWSSRIKERQEHFAAPSILRPLITILIQTGNISAPVGKWWIEWPESSTQNPLQDAQVASAKAAALATYANSPDARYIVPEPEFRKSFLGMEPESDYEIELPEEIPEEDLGDGPPMSEEPEIEDPEGDPSSQDEQQPTTNAEAKTLYVRRDVKNLTTLKAWAKEQGISLEPDPHITVMYSKTPVDWMRMGVDWYASVPTEVGEDEEDRSLMIQPGGPRLISMFGPNSDKLYAVVLEVYSEVLQWRHKHMTDQGAVHTFKEYKPHITLFYTDDPDFDLGSIAPYQGAIALGPEIFEEVEP